MAGSPLLTRYDITDLNNGLVAEYPVADPPGWDDISLFYAKALKKMGWQRSRVGDADVESMWPYSETPSSYYFQAAMHWWPKYPSEIPPPPHDAYWCHCTHGPASSEQFFLPWHRAYIYFYEVLVRAQVESLGGPDGWALPYWNYSDFDGSNPSVPWPRSRLPWAFCEPTLPDGSDNPLFMDDIVKRGLQPTRPGSSDPMYLKRTTPFYYQAFGHDDYERFNSTLDNWPHGVVHVDTGTGAGLHPTTGWMRSTVTASFDPIFWLHHAEIDRFWIGWNADGHDNPSHAGWLNAEEDELRDTRWNFWADGKLDNKLVVYPGDMVEPADLDDRFPHSYTYANLPQTPAPAPPGLDELAAAVPRLVARRTGVASVPRTAAAADHGPLELGNSPVTASVALPDRARAAVARLAELGDDAHAPHVTLHIDGIASEGPAGNYEVYLNHPEADRTTEGMVPHFVGVLSSFGAEHHHAHGAEGGEGHGGNAQFDVTSIVAYLRMHGGWNERDAQITFVPTHAETEGETAPAALQVQSISFETR